MKYQNDEEKLKLLPDIVQLKNRSQQLRTRGDFAINSMADIMVWATPQLCKTREDFYKI
ncbi:hypothetical protein PHMEG_00040864 [Phytophthora megakarya]|uniref:Transposase n=1 Tax=Phytophthora megakarya TaxID=4795 RepID=A0A225UDZ7_9STRA|nr:hypothetical protein PHMEG_00040864 [Phytophthora megakarya]